MSWKELCAMLIRRQPCSVGPSMTRRGQKFRRPRTAEPPQVYCPAGLEHPVLRGIARRAARTSDDAAQATMVAILGRKGLNNGISKTRSQWPEQHILIYWSDRTRGGAIELLMGLENLA